MMLQTGRHQKGSARLESQEDCSNVITSHGDFIVTIVFTSYNLSLYEFLLALEHSTFVFKWMSLMHFDVDQVEFICGIV